MVRARALAVGGQVEVNLDLSPRAGGTRVRWDARVTRMTGLLKAIPRTTLAPMAERAAARGWAVVRERLAQEG